MTRETYILLHILAICTLHHSNRHHLPIKVKVRIRAWSFRGSMLFRSCNAMPPKCAWHGSTRWTWCLESLMSRVVKNSAARDISPFLWLTILSLEGRLGFYSSCTYWNLRCVSRQFCRGTNLFLDSNSRFIYFAEFVCRGRFISATICCNR